MSSQSKQKVESAVLSQALRADTRSNRDLAAAAGISFLSITEARNGIPRDELKERRKRLGVVASMTRLALCLKIDPTEVLSELGLDPTDDPGIQRQLERAREASVERSLEQEEEDPIIRAVRARESRAREAPEGSPRVRLGPIVGVVPWKPFSAGDVASGSVAKLLTRSVLGSLDPAWDRDVHLQPEENFLDAEKRLLSDSDDKPDLLIGLYDLPWRRRGDVDVIPLPALSVAVGGFCTRGISWKEILATRDDALPHALVIQGDVGDRLLTGPVDYPSNLLLPPIATLDPSAIARRIQREVEAARTAVPAHDLLFVADGPLAKDVQDLLANSKLRGISDPKWAPVVGFGFAVPHDAHRFKELLAQAISEDLFGRALPRTVHLYMKLLRNDRSRQIHLDLTALDVYGPNKAAAFIELALAERDGEALLRAYVEDKRHVDDIDRIINERNSKEQSQA